MIKLTLVIGQDRRSGRVSDRGKWPMPGPQDERAWYSVEQLQMFTWLDMKGNKSDISQGRSSRIKLPRVILSSLDHEMPSVFYAEKNDTIIFWKWFSISKTLERLLWSLCGEKGLWKMILVFLWRIDVMETRQEAKNLVLRLWWKARWEMVVPSISNTAVSREGRRQIEMYLRGGKTELGEWWIRYVGWEKRGS